MKLVLHKEHRQTAVIEKGDLRTWLWHQFDEYHHGITVHFKDGHEIDLGPYSFDEAKEVEQQLLELVGERRAPKKKYENMVKTGTAALMGADLTDIQKAAYIDNSKNHPTPEENIFDIFYEFTSKLRLMLKDLNLPTKVVFRLPPKVFDMLMLQAEGRVPVRDNINPFDPHLDFFTEINGFKVERR